MESDFTYMFKYIIIGDTCTIVVNQVLASPAFYFNSLKISSNLITIQPLEYSSAPK